jgi:competence protein ComGC
MFCSKCGAQIDDQAQFCPQCGTTSPVMAQPPAPPPGPPTQPPYAVPGQYVPQYTPPPPTDGKATASLILGIMSVICFGILAGIPAIILGHISRSNIQKSGGKLKGEGLALAGLIMGYFSLVLSLLFITAITIPSLLKARQSANESAAAATVRTLNTTEVTYSITYPDQGYAPRLATLGPGSQSSANCTPSATHACLIDATLGCGSPTWCVKDQYKYSVVAAGSPKPDDYVITATPMNTGAASRSFCATADSIVRYKYGTVTSPLASVDDCQTWTPL